MSQSLQSVTVDQLRSELTAAELEALPSAVMDGAEYEQVQAWLQERLLQAADRVVGAVNTCARNAAIKSGLCKVPAACVRTVLVLARHAVISAIPGMAETLEGGTRAAEYSTATRELESLASCSLVPDYALASDEMADGGSCGVTLMFGEKLNKFRW
jgi:hypothetical protein